MSTPKSHFILITSLLLILSSGLSAQDLRYQNIHQATHVSSGWIAYSNGELFKCTLPISGKKAPSCALTTGLPSGMQTVSLLWADGDVAWVTYTDGQLYGCRSQHKAPVCMPATGLP